MTFKNETGVLNHKLLTQNDELLTQDKSTCTRMMKTSHLNRDLSTCPSSATKTWMAYSYQDNINLEDVINTLENRN